VDINHVTNNKTKGSNRMDVLRDMIQSRVGDLELQLQVTRGRVSGISETLVEEKEGVHQLEGALMEAQNTLTLIEQEARRAVEEAEEQEGQKHESS
jgi:hypothetical protein